MCCSWHHQGKGHALDAVIYPDNKEDECVCPGTGNKPFCCGAITGPDNLCDRCREHCPKTVTEEVNLPKELSSVSSKE